MRVKNVLLLLLWLAAFPARTDEMGDAEPRMGMRLGGFSPDLFKFVTIIPYKGGVAGGWQEAFAVLKFVDGRQDPAQKWTCSVRVGMPIRSEKQGTISPVQAAVYTADIATDASSVVMHRQPYWLTAEYCFAFHVEMRAQFEKYFRGLGAKVGQN